MKAESIIFDMDGTLWDSGGNVAAAWNEAIRAFPECDILLTAEDIHSVMGLTMDVITDKLFPMLTEERRKALMNNCIDSENEYLKAHGGLLFDDVERVFEELSREHRLFIVSNCQSGYIEGFLEYYGLGRFITDHICWGDNGFSKGDNIKHIMEKNRIDTAVYVGDTQGDCDSAYYAGTGFVYAAYGFGTADRFDAEIHAFGELLDIIE